MNPTLKSDLKKSLAGVLVLAAAFTLYCEWKAGAFSPQKLPSKEFLLDVARERVEKENEKQEAAIQRGQTNYPYYDWQPRSLDKIKNATSWPQGKISLYPIGYMNVARDAGIEAPKAGQVTVLLINDTDDSLEVPTQDGDIYLKLEVNLDGKWRRAQWHRYSWCGNSYTSRGLPPRSYVPVFGYQPTVGRLGSKTRYVVKNGAEDSLMSDETDGVYSPDDVNLSEFDAMAFSNASLPEIRSFLLRERVPTLLPYGQRIDELRRSAFNGIVSGRHDMKTALSMAREMLADDPTLESNPDMLEKWMSARRASRDEKAKGTRRIHGFTIKEVSSPDHEK